MMPMMRALMISTSCLAWRHFKIKCSSNTDLKRKTTTSVFKTKTLSKSFSKSDKNGNWQSSVKKLLKNRFELVG